MARSPVLVFSLLLVAAAVRVGRDAYVSSVAYEDELWPLGADPRPARGGDGGAFLVPEARGGPGRITVSRVTSEAPPAVPAEA